MKKFKILSIAAVLFLCVGLLAGCGGSDTSESASGTTSEAEVYAQDFKLNNATGVEIHGVYLSPVGVDTWEDNILTQATLADGASVDISFDADTDDQYWDLRVTDASGNELVFTNLDLFTISEVTLKLDASGAPTAEVK